MSRPVQMWESDAGEIFASKAEADAADASQAENDEHARVLALFLERVGRTPRIGLGVLNDMLDEGWVFTPPVA
jgi:hypothetical protein